jgi:hypothetical protein
MTAKISRRSVLRGSVLTAVGATVGSQLFAAPAHAEGQPDTDAVRNAQQQAQEDNARVLSGTQSKNGWEMEKVVDDRGNVYTRPVPGTPLDFAVRMGDVERVRVSLSERILSSHAAMSSCSW